MQMRRLDFPSFALVSKDFDAILTRWVIPLDPQSSLVKHLLHGYLAAVAQVPPGTFRTQADTLGPQLRTHDNESDHDAQLYASMPP